MTCFRPRINVIDLVRNVRRFRPWYVSTYLIKKWTSLVVWPCLGFFLIMIFFLGQFMITLWWNQQYVHSRFFFFNDLILLISKVSLLLFITLCRLIWWYPVIDFKVQERKIIHEGLHNYFINWKIWLEKLIICGFFFLRGWNIFESLEVSWNNGWKRYEENLPSF